MRHFRFGFLCLALATLLLPLSSCAMFRPWDPVSGQWAGHWYVASMPNPGGKLRCTVDRVEKHQWKALFEAEFGQTGTWKVELLGKREGDKVLFGGDVDLGAASGGVFTWTGEADGTNFNGKYKSKLYGGHFEMTRAQP